MLTASVFSIRQGVGLARRARPDEIERAQVEGRTQRISPNESVTAIARLWFDIDARDVKARELQTAGCPSRTTEEIKGSRTDHDGAPFFARRRGRLDGSGWGGGSGHTTAGLDAAQSAGRPLTSWGNPSAPAHRPTRA